MDKFESSSSSNSEEEDEKNDLNINLKISDIDKNESKKPFFSAFGSGSIKEEKINNTKDEKISIIRRPSLIEKNLIESVQKRENITKENLELAEKINFKNNTDKLIETDEFGFYTNQTEKYDGENQKIDEKNIPKQSMALTKEELLKINARTEKWTKMIKYFEKYKTKKKDKLKSRTRKGIPDSIRSQAWQLLANTDKLITNKNLFKDLDNVKLDSETEMTIIKDLDRTFPMCQLFKDKYGAGQRKLFRVLANYSKYNQKLGYVQGMGYLAAIFLIYMDEESSFYMLHSIVKNYEFEGLYEPSFPDLKKKFYVLLNLEKKFIPQIYDILKRDEVYASIYASEWFLCLFSKDLKPKILMRIIDVFLYEGYKVIYRFALAFLKMKEKVFISNKKGIFYSMNTIKQLFDDLNIDEIFKVAFSFRLSRSHIAKYEKEYEENIDNKNNEFIKQL